MDKNNLKLAQVPKTEEIREITENENLQQDIISIHKDKKKVIKSILLILNFKSIQLLSSF